MAKPRRNRRYNEDPPGKVLARGGIVLALLAVFIWLGGTLYNGVPGRNYKYVSADVPTTGSLIPHDPIRIGGVRVGQVKAIDTTTNGDALVKLQLDPGTKVPDDTQILIRANGLLGARFVELVPGKSSTQLADGKQLKGGPNALTYGVPETLDVLDQQTRGKLRPLLGELGTGTLGQGQNVNDTLRTAGTAIDPAADVFKYLAQHPKPVHGFLPSLNYGLAPLDANRQGIGKLFGASSDALQPFVQERQATRDTLDAAPPALTAANSGLTAGRTLLTSVRALSTEASQTLPTAPRGLRETALLLTEARTPLKQANTLLKAVGPTVPAALKLTGALKPVLAPLTQTFTNLTPMLAQIGKYRCDIENFGAVFRSMTGFGSANPGGPGGSPMEFRLQIAAPQVAEALSLDSGGQVQRESYPPPCKYLSKPYPQFLARSAGTK